MDQGRGKEREKNKIFFYFEKEKIQGPTRFEERFRPFPSNGARKLVGYFNDAK
jgi:hypothetical protein